MLKVILLSAVAGKVMTPAPLPVASTAPVPWLMTCQEPMTPAEPDASRMLILDTVVAAPHLIEMEPVEPAGDQKVLRSPSRTSPYPVPAALLEPSDPAPMLRSAPVGWVGPGVGLVGPGVRRVGPGPRGAKLPFDTCRPLLAPAVWPTISGTQPAPSRLYGYGMLTVVLDCGFGPAGLFSLPGTDQVTLSKTLPPTCQ